MTAGERYIFDTLIRPRLDAMLRPHKGFDLFGPTEPYMTPEEFNARWCPAAYLDAEPATRCPTCKRPLEAA